MEGAGDAFRELLRDFIRALGRSDIRCPAAEGGALGVVLLDNDEDAIVDSCWNGL